MLPTSNVTPMISHVQLSEMTGKRQDSVKRTIENLSKSSVITFTQFVEKGNGRPLTVFSVNERDSYIVVAQLCPEYTAKLVDHWMETKNKQPALPQTFAEALQLAADQAKQLELAAPKVAFVEKLVERQSLMNATQVAQKLGKSAVWLNKQLAELTVYNKSVKRGRAFQQWFIDKHYGEMKETELGFSQALFTTAGEFWIFEKLTSEGVI